MNLPMLLAQVILSIVAGAYVTQFAYYTPFMIISSLLMAVGASLLSTFQPDIGSGKWIGYQVIFGAGVGTGMQQALIAVQRLGILYFSLLLQVSTQVSMLPYSVCLLDALFASEPPCHLLPRLVTMHPLLSPSPQIISQAVEILSSCLFLTFLQRPTRLEIIFLSPAWIPTTSPMFRSTSDIFKHISEI